MNYFDKAIYSLTDILTDFDFEAKNDEFILKKELKKMLNLVFDRLAINRMLK